MDVRPEGTPAATFAVRAWTALQWARATPCGSRLLFAHLSLSLGAASRSFGSTSYDSRILFCSSRGSVNVQHADITNTSGQTRGLTSYSPYPPSLGWENREYANTQTAQIRRNTQEYSAHPARSAAKIFGQHIGVSVEIFDAICSYLGTEYANTQAI
jgi:hypothetical protein